MHQDQAPSDTILPTEGSYPAPRQPSGIPGQMASRVLGSLSLGLVFVHVFVLTMMLLSSLGVETPNFLNPVYVLALFLSFICSPAGVLLAVIGMILGRSAMRVGSEYASRGLSLAGMNLSSGPRWCLTALIGHLAAGLFYVLFL